MRVWVKRVFVSVSKASVVCVSVSKAFVCVSMSVGKASVVSV